MVTINQEWLAAHGAGSYGLDRSDKVQEARFALARAYAGRPRIFFGSDICAPLAPAYDYASGSQNPTGGHYYTTFNQLFAFSHYYLGWLDLVARQNIQDFNTHLYLYPTKWIRFWLQYHHFELANAHDALYNAGGKPIARDPTGPPVPTSAMSWISL